MAKRFKINLSDEIALKFIGKLNTSKQYRVGAELRNKINLYKAENGTIRQRKQVHTMLKKEMGIPDDKLEVAANSDMYWDKSKEFSFKVRNPFTYKNQKVKSFFEEFLEELQSYQPTYPKIKRKKIKEPHLLVVDIADLHINKFCEVFMTGYDYDSSIAIERAVDGVRGLLKKSVGYEIEKILFVLGNDVLNTDGKSKATTNGTPQDTDLHWWKAYKLAKLMYIECIEMCLGVADVECVHCPSNHDYHSGTCLADSLKSWFRNWKNITFQDSPKYRKYFHYYSNMIELEHGEKGKMANIPLLMAQEEPKIWAQTKYRYGYIHHVHHSDKQQFQSSKDFIGANITYLRSPSPADIWHAESGYKNTVAIEGFIHSREHGRVSHLTHYF